MSTGDRGGSSDGLAPRPHAGAVLASGVVETLGGGTDTATDATEADGGPDAVLEDFVAFTRLVRNAVVPVTTDRVAAYLQALRLSDLTSEVSTYWAGRLLIGDSGDDTRCDLRALSHSPARVDAPPRLCLMIATTQRERQTSGHRSRAAGRAHVSRLARRPPPSRVLVRAGGNRRRAEKDHRTRDGDRHGEVRGVLQLHL